MDEEKIRLLQEADWDDIGPRLLKYAWTLLPPSDHCMGSTAEDVVNEAIALVIRGASGEKGRAWNPETQPLFTHLKWIIRSILSSKGWRGREKRDPLARAIPDEKSNDGFEDETAFQNEYEESVRQRVKAVEKAVENESELRDYVAAMLCGAKTPSEISEMTGLPIERIYECPRKLERRIAKINEAGLSLSKPPDHS